jgi:hypothetical protein
MNMRSNLTKIRDIAKDVEHGHRNMKALVFCILALTREVEELKEKVSK